MAEKLAGLTTAIQPLQVSSDFPRTCCASAHQPLDTHGEIAHLWGVKKKLGPLSVVALVGVACGGTDAPDFGAPGSSTNQLQSIHVTLDLAALPLGVVATAVATGRFADGTQVDKTAEAEWSSSDEAVATIAVVDGVAKLTTAAEGTAAIEATVGTVTGSFDVTVAPAALTEFTVTPANLVMRAGEQIQLVASGKFTDGSSRDLTQEVEWSAQRPTVIEVSASGLASAMSLGQSAITARKDGFEGSATASVQCMYPQAGSSVTYGATLPGMSWTGGYTEGGGMADLSLEQMYCEGSAYDSILFVIGAGWCPNCPAYMRRVNDMSAQLTDANQKIVYVEIETASRTPAHHADAKHTVDRYIGEDGTGLRVGDADTNPLPMVFARAVRGVPGAFIVRTHDMKVIASQGESQYILDFLRIAQNPNRMW